MVSQPSGLAKGRTRWRASNNPADSPEVQLEQRIIIVATQRALDYAHKRGAT